jgi:hypothetical protein
LSKRLKITGLEIPALFALQKSNKNDRLWQPIVALEVGNFAYALLHPKK